MGQYPLLIFFGIMCFIMPINLLVTTSVVGVMLADTRLVPMEFIYIARFLPMGMLAFKTLMKAFIKREPKKGSFSLVKIWLPFILLVFLSISYSLEPSMSLQRSISMLLALIGFGIGIPLYIQDSQKMSRLIWMVAIVMGCAILYSVYSASGHESSLIIVEEEYERLYGIFKNPNTLGLLSMQGIFLMIYLWQKEENKSYRIFLFIISAMFGVAIMISGSRASALGFLCGLLVFIWGNNRIRKKTMPGLLTGILLLGSIYLLAGYLFPEYAGGIFRTDTAGRVSMLKRDWEFVLDAPYLGVGFGGSDRLFIENTLYNRMHGKYLLGTHSSVMKVLVELGFVGGLLVVSAFSILIHRAIKYLPRFKDPLLGVAMLSVIAASILNSVFEAWLFAFGNSSTVPFWLFLSILCFQIDQVKVTMRQRAHEYAMIPKIQTGKNFSYKD